MRTQLVKVDSTQPEAAKIKKAALILRNGGLVAFPTETVYGLGANMLDKDAIKKVYRIKNRPEGKPLTIHIADVKILKKMVGRIPSNAKKLIAKFWPGPLTLVLRDKASKKTGFRIPDNRIAFLLIKEAAVPVVAPSANISGKRPPTDAQEVLKNLSGKIEMVLDGGKTQIGVESTVVDLSGRQYKILREGAISGEKIKEALR
ncbi:MAG: L-threonylcarbamoyladenylate synthase [Candidatus Omnitrophota bacterium]